MQEATGKNNTIGESPAENQSSNIAAGITANDTDNQHLTPVSNEAETKTKEALQPQPAAEKKSKRKTPGKIIAPPLGKTEEKNKAESTRKSSGKTTAEKKPVKRVRAKKVAVPKILKISFRIKFHTKFGQSLFITGNHKIFGNNDMANALAMQYYNEEYWIAEIDLAADDISANGIVYNYVVKFEDGTCGYDWGNDKVLDSSLATAKKIFISDSWNAAGYYENAFYTEPFRNVLLKQNYTPVKVRFPRRYTHVFKVKAPLLEKGQTLCLLGSGKELTKWNEKKPLLMSKAENEDSFTLKINLSKEIYPIYYKYGVYDANAKKFLHYEGGQNRVLYAWGENFEQTVINDGFVMLPANTWKGAGINVPVFSLRSSKGFGVGEFTDLKLLVDWAKKTGMKLIQLLPVNDTTATHTWTDSYPYAAISVFALHPIYLDLEKAAGEAHKHLLEEIKEEKQRLNNLPDLDYEAVITLKWQTISKLYQMQKNAVFASENYQQYFAQNKHWLLPYAAFCFLRDKYKTADFTKWGEHSKYSEELIQSLFDTSAEDYDDVAIHLLVQFHLHLQLKEATKYAHENGVILKGDIPIGTYRYGADTWQHSALFHMDAQAGAPPDDFAVTGQNWGFPTYNWEKMREDGYAWWKQRFAQMSYYFDAFRIDHILGFFRIWSIPLTAVEGIMGHFDPSVPVHINEFYDRGIWFNHERYCAPFINDTIISDIFGDQQEYVRENFLISADNGTYHLRTEFATQRQVEKYFTHFENNEHNERLKKLLLSLISNVILLQVEGSKGLQFHFRFGMENTSSFRHLDAHTQYQLKELYINYFFWRQDFYWKQQGLQKLPAIKRSTSMLICGEDLGFVPHCVPEVMKELGILSLEIQRMPKDSKKQFFNPAEAPYLSVVTPSTHDMSTIRGWWEEDRQTSQLFFTEVLGGSGYAPPFCDADISKAIVLQHLHSHAMWSIFLLQDILGIDSKMRRQNPHEERINVPANPKNYWRYRMHLTLENLLDAEDFNKELLIYVRGSGRA